MGEKIVVVTDSVDGPGMAELDVSEMSDDELKKYAADGVSAAVRELVRRLDK